MKRTDRQTDGHPPFQSSDGVKNRCVVLTKHYPFFHFEYFKNYLKNKKSENITIINFIFRRPLHSKGRLYISRCVSVVPFWKPSNTNETRVEAGQQRILNKAQQTHFLIQRLQISHRSSYRLSEQSTNVKKYKSTKYS